MPTQPGKTRRNVQTKVGCTPQLWKRLIFGAVHDAKLTHCGIPTDLAIYSRLWIEHVANKADRYDWLTSFEHACDMVGRDAGELRAKLLRKVDEAWRQASERHVRSEIYMRRLMVLVVSGVTMRLARQSLLGLVAEADYDVVAGEASDPATGRDQGDLFVLCHQREEAAV